MSIRPVKPTQEHREAALDFRNEFFNHGEKVINGSEMLSQIMRIAVNAGLSSLRLSAERTNVPSVKSILKNGGVWERSFTYEGEPVDVYDIKLR